MSNNTSNNTSNIIHARHPDYTNDQLNWRKYRLTYEGGQDFIEEYLKMFSSREKAIEFEARKSSTYCPAHAKTAVNEIKDAICERLVDVTRTSGPISYKHGIQGLNGGVDRLNTTMNGFMGNYILPELLPMRKVGVFVDRPELPEQANRSEVGQYPPYLYVYNAEHILNWAHDTRGELIAVLLRDTEYDADENGLPKGTKFQYRFLRTTDAGVEVTIYDKDGHITDSLLLNLRMLPFVLFQLKQSLLTDIANYQIALLNLGSSDLAYAIKSNFPFYTEQFDPRDFATNLLQSADGDGTSEDANVSKDNDIAIGVAQGRRYPKGLDRPNFIHPSSDPLKASMEKQKALQVEIRELVRLAVKSLASSSADSKEQDQRSVESGLASIGLELERGERQIGNIWADYEHADAAIIRYPTNYSLRSDSERLSEAEEIEKHIPKTPSDKLKRHLSKQVAAILVGHKVTNEDMQAIYQEIDGADVIITDPEVIRDDLEAGLVSTSTASRLRGYPEGEVEQAKIDHAERIERIVIAQTKGAAAEARGTDDLSSDSAGGRQEKTLSRNADLDDTPTDKTRGAE